MDRREFPRVPYGAWVEDEGAEGGLRFYMAQNLSVGGMLLQSTENIVPKVGTKVRLRLVVENESRVMSVHGEVVRHVPEITGGFAVRFTSLDPVRKTFLEELVSELAPPSGATPAPVK